MNASEIRDYSWEVLPKYNGDPSVSFSTAIKNGEGHCGYRSAIIGRKALELGLPARRRISFGRNQMPHSLGNYVRYGETWLSIGTAHVLNSGAIGSAPADFDETSPYVVRDGTSVDILRPDAKLRSAMLLCLPEVWMPLFNGCYQVSDWLETAQYLAGSADQGNGLDV